VSGYTARNPLMPPEAPSWLPPEDAAVLERLRSPAALNPLLGPDPYGGAAIGTSSTAPQAQAVDANGQPFDPVVGRGLPVTRGQLAGIAESAWRTAGAVSDGGLAAPGMAGGMMAAIKAYHTAPEPFTSYDWSRLGTTTQPNISGSPHADWAMNLAKIGPWASEKLLAENIVGVALPVEISGTGRAFKSLDTLEAAVRKAGGPEAFRKELVEKGFGHVRVADEEFGGKSYIGLTPETFVIRQK